VSVLLFDVVGRDSVAGIKLGVI